MMTIHDDCGPSIEAWPSWKCWCVCIVYSASVVVTISEEVLLWESNEVLLRESHSVVIIIQCVTCWYWSIDYLPFVMFILLLTVDQWWCSGGIDYCYSCYLLKSVLCVVIFSGTIWYYWLLCASDYDQYYYSKYWEKWWHLVTEVPVQGNIDHYTEADICAAPVAGWERKPQLLCPSSGSEEYIEAVTIIIVWNTMRKWRESQVKKLIVNETPLACSVMRNSMYY